MWHYETLSIHGGYWLFEYLLFIMLCTSDPVKWNCLLYLYDIRMAWRVNIELCEQRRTQSLTWCKILFLNTTIKFFPPIFYTHTLFIKKMNLNLRAFLHCEHFTFLFWYNNWYRNVYKCCLFIYTFLMFFVWLNCNI